MGAAPSPAATCIPRQPLGMTAARRPGDASSCDVLTIGYNEVCLSMTHLQDLQRHTSCTDLRSYLHVTCNGHGQESLCFQPPSRGLKYTEDYVIKALGMRCDNADDNNELFHHLLRLH